MSDGAFPETPRGSPEAIETAAEMLSGAAELVGEGESTLTQTTRGLSGVAWSGMAEGRFTAAAGGLSGVCDGAQEALRTCARAAERYAQTLDRAKRIIEAEREEYEEAKAAQASGAELVGDLSLRRSHVEPDRQGSFDEAITDAQDQVAAAADRATAALIAAQSAREDFDRAEAEVIAQLDGTAPGSTSVFGAPAVPAVGGFAMAPAFPASGTGGWGSAGGGFGVPAGGLAAFTGFVAFDRLGDVDGYAKSAFQDRHGQTEVDDLTIAITSVASLGTAGPLSALASRGATGAAARTGGTAATGGARTAAGRAGTSAADDAARARAATNAHLIEKYGDAAGMAGLPLGGSAGQVAAHLSYPAVRATYRAFLEQYLSGAKQMVAPKLATLLAARALSQGVRKGVPDDAAARLRELSNVP